MGVRLSEPGDEPTFFVELVIKVVVRFAWHTDIHKNDQEIVNNNITSIPATSFRPASVWQNDPADIFSCVLRAFFEHLLPYEVLLHNFVATLGKVSLPASSQLGNDLKIHHHQMFSAWMDDQTSSLADSRH